MVQHKSFWNLVLLTVMLFIAALINVPFVLGAEGKVQLLDDWVYDEEVLNIDDELFILSLTPTWDRLYIQGEEESVIVDQGYCEILNYKEFCYLTAIFDPSEGYGKKDYKRNKILPSIHLIVSDLRPQIVVTRTITNTTPHLQDTVTVKMNILNNGLKAADMVTYRETIPVEAVIMEHPLLKREGNVLEWKGSVVYGSNVTLSYELVFTKVFTGTINASLNYTYDGIPYSSAYKDITVTTAVPKIPLTITPTIDKNPAAINELVTYTVTLTNTDPSERVTIKEMLIRIGDNLIITSYEPLQKKTDHDFIYNTDLQPGETKTFSLGIIGILTGNYGVTLSVNASSYWRKEQRNLDEFHTDNKTLTVKLGEVRPTIHFLLNDLSLLSGDESLVEIWLENTDERRSFHNITAVVSTDYPYFENASSTVEVLYPKEKKVIYTKSFMAPWVEEEKQYSVNVKGSYHTQNNEEFTYSKAESFQVNAREAEASVQIVQTVPSSIEENSTAIVKVSVTNIKEYPLENIKVTDTYPDLTFVSGASSTRFDRLKAGETKEVYQYKLSAPLGINITETTIRTTVEYEEDGLPYGTTAEKVIAVTKLPEEVPLQVEENLTEIVEVNESELQENITDQVVDNQTNVELEKEPGFFTRLLEGMASFFGKLFG